MKKVLDTLNATTNDNMNAQRRGFSRRSMDTCLVSVNGIPYPVKDWSLSGILFEADTRTFCLNETLPMTLKFHAGGTVSTVDVTGCIVRKNARFVATHFDPLPNQVEQTLHKIIDLSNAEIAEKSKKA